jgi:DNA-binding transcriptional ArsR family regulator
MSNTAYMEPRISFPIASANETSEQLAIDTHVFKKAATIVRAVNHQLRHEILLLLHTNNSLTVTEIFTHLGLEQSVASQHLAVLRQAGCVRTRREGKLVWYSVNYRKLADLEKFSEDIIRRRRW